MVLVLGFLCRFFDGYRVSQTRKSLYVASRNAVLPALVEIAGAKLFVRHLVFEDVVAHDEYLVADGDEGFLFPPSAHETMVFRPEVGPFRLRGDPSEFGQYGLEVFVPMGSDSRLLLPRAFVVARAHA